MQHFWEDSVRCRHRPGRGLQPEGGRTIGVDSLAFLSFLKKASVAGYSLTTFIV